ncbi:hypothetical protein B0J12DRAFT_662005 [Macrophomina phaseolina]|uniref:Uncharacterized protein n=1 Tax=Macrophomina phaseolina TaxID=35725 RepID=A0ABQ8GEE1_9PEZI|nr:hypothetical protein B0J12DRAFT_662005 [Macrophomina phaseolina]
MPPLASWSTVAGSGTARWSCSCSCCGGRSCGGGCVAGWAQGCANGWVDEPAHTLIDDVVDCGEEERERCVSAARQAALAHASLQRLSRGPRTHARNGGRCSTSGACSILGVPLGIGIRASLGRFSQWASCSSAKFSLKPRYSMHSFECRMSGTLHCGVGLSRQA